jgi:hypothetical protein
MVARVVTVQNDDHQISVAYDPSWPNYRDVIEGVLGDLQASPEDMDKFQITVERQGNGGQIWWAWKERPDSQPLTSMVAYIGTSLAAFSHAAALWALMRDGMGLKEAFRGHTYVMFEGAVVEENKMQATLIERATAAQEQELERLRAASAVVIADAEKAKTDAEKARADDLAVLKARVAALEAK